MWYFKVSIYENIMFSTIKSLRIFNSKLFYFGHSSEKLIEWLAENKFNYLNWYWSDSGLQWTFHINLIRAYLEANDLMDHGQFLVQCF